MGMNVQGTWTLVITNVSTTGTTGTLNGWSLTFQKPLPTNGMGQAGSDDPTTSFQLLTLAPVHRLLEPGLVAGGRRVEHRRDRRGHRHRHGSLRPSGNTVYVGGASGGVWKTTNFLTTNPNGPTWIPLTNFGPNAAINISSISIFPRNDNPDQSIIIVGTGGSTSGEQNTTAPGVGFLISTDGGVTWNIYDSTINVSGTVTKTSGNGHVLPINSPPATASSSAPAYQVAIDPQLSPTGQVIIYAAVSGPGTVGGIWESQNTGQSWTQVLAGNATSVVLDQDSGIVLDPSTDTDVKGNLQIAYAAIYGQGIFMTTNQGQNWTLMNGGIGNPLIINLPTGRQRQPGQPNAHDPNGTPGQDRPVRPRLDRQRRAGRDLRGLALRGRRHPDRRLLRPVRHQGLRRELDPGPARHPSPRPLAVTTSPSPATYSQAIGVRQPHQSRLPDHRQLAQRQRWTSPWAPTRPIPTSSTWAGSAATGTTATPG